MFFGLGWALMSLMGLVYLQSMILPHTFGGFTYFLTTFVGHYGVILSALYFLIYCPVVLIFPSYYVSRIWSIILILAANLLIFFDAYLFGKFRFHLNSFLWNFFQEENSLEAFGFNSAKLGIMTLVIVALFVVLWIRGETLWRKMCARFSNPVKNWYLVFILISFITSHLMYMYASAKANTNITRLATLFPLNFTLTASEALSERGIVKEEIKVGDRGHNDLYYPSRPLECPMKAPKNILMIVLNEWPGDADSYLAPSLEHLKSHALYFNNHHTGGLNSQDGLFSLLYSIPPVYAQSAINDFQDPAIVTQFKKSKIDMRFYKTDGESPIEKYLPGEKEVSTGYIQQFLTERDEQASLNPYFMHVYLAGGSLSEKDSQVKEILGLMVKHKQTQNTIIIVTSAKSEKLVTPLMIVWPGKRPAVVSRFTSHYDVLPTIMLEDWRCKNKISDYSFGHNLLSNEETSQFVAGNYEYLVIMDPKDKIKTVIDHSFKLQFEGPKRPEMSSILKALSKATQFYRPR